MKLNGNLCLDVRSVPPLEAAIDQWLVARKCEMPRHL